jgi:two-component system response regulator HydG
MASVLVVDDEAPIAALLRAILGRAGHDVWIAFSADDAKTACQAQGFDIVLSDVVMPRTNGHELTRWIAQNYPKTRTLLMSGFDFDRQNRPYTPQYNLIRKPFAPDEVIAAVEDTLR